MATYREMIYMVLDEAKIASDDAFYTKEHIMFLLNKYRAAVLKQNYIQSKAVNRSYQYSIVQDDNYQMLCIDLVPTASFDGIECVGNDYLKSKEKLPSLLNIGTTRLSTADQFQGDMSLVSNIRFPYASSRYSRDWIYGTIGKDGYLYLKSCNPQFYYLESVKLTAVFANPEKAANLECGESDNCELLDKRYPLEEALIPFVIKGIIDEIYPKSKTPQDTSNNAHDDLTKQANNEQ